MNPRHFFAELKRRNVYKVAIAYGVVAWLLMQIASQIFPFFEIPNWAVRLVVLLLIIGFPVALILAWAFELTREGIKRAENVDLDASRVSKNRAWIYVVLIGGAISVALFFLGRYTARNHTATVEAPTKSIAVLPFKPITPQEGNQVLELGMADTLITKLSGSREIIVPSLTSVRKYGNLDQDPVVAGRELQVKSVLEGNVQKVGDHIRVTARLINVLDGSSLWAGTFDEKFTDVFAVQDAISQKVAAALALRLSGSEKERLTKRYTDNVEAYQLYLTGRYH
jgi:TolB-like protein